jgi:hypothetical protein
MGFCPALFFAAEVDTLLGADPTAPPAGNAGSGALAPARARPPQADAQEGHHGHSGRGEDDLRVRGDDRRDLESLLKGA